MSFPAVFNVDNLDGKNGFILTSSAPWCRSSGCGIGALVTGIGDINGDGKSDLMVGTFMTERFTSRDAYVVFGSNTFPASLDVLNLNGSNGFTLSSSEDGFGHESLSGLCDINGDGKNDLSVGAYEYGYVLFGDNKFPSAVDIDQLIYASNGTKGFRIIAPDNKCPWDGCEYLTAGIGDINNDGYADLIVGSGLLNEAYIIFGASSFPATFNISSLNGKNGVILTSSSGGFGGAVSGVGDINNDGKPDLIVGGDSEAFVVFGANSFPAVFNMSNLNGTNGFIVTSEYEFTSLSCVGDVNNDGKSDFSVGRYQNLSVVFGARNFPVIFNISNLNGENGFVVTSSLYANFAYSGASVGDINGDNRSDFIVGGDSKAYVIFGAHSFPAIFNTSNLDGINGFALISNNSDVNLGRIISVAGLGDISGDGITDLIIGAQAVDKAYIVFGQQKMMQYQNYGMLSQAQYFVPMNSTDKTGSMNLGSIGEWCTHQSLFVGDFNGDGRSDLLCSLLNGQNYIMLSQMRSDDVTFVPMGTDPDGEIKIYNNDRWCLKDTQELLIGDFNGDKKSDLLCHNNQQQPNQGFTYVMLSTGGGFKPMADSPDGYVTVGKLGHFCPIGGRLIIGNFDGLYGDDLLCNSHTGENMIMVSTNTSFVSINSDILGSVTLGLKQQCKGWCANVNATLMRGDFNNDNKTDLICNDRGENQIMISTFNKAGCDFQPINPASNDQQPNGWIKMGQGKVPTWCDTLYAKLAVADIDGDNLDDLVCNDKGAHKVQLYKYVTNDQYEFRSINKVDPSGDGSIKVASYDRWCNSQNISTGHFSDTGLDDLWCNQANSPIGEIYDEQT